MMDNGFLHSFLRDLMFQSPYLFFYAVGMICALIYWRRYPLTSLFALLGFLIKTLAGLGYALAPSLLLQNDGAPSFQSVLYMIAIVDSSAYVLLLLAIFSGRATITERRPPRPRDRTDDADDYSPPKPASPNSDDGTGIQERR